MYFFFAPFSCEENGFPELPNIYDVGAKNPDPALGDDGDKTMEEVLAAEPEATQVTPPTGDGATEEVADPPSKSGEMSAMHNCNAAFLYLDIYMAFLTTTERLYFVYLLRCCRSSRTLWDGTTRYPICDVERLYSREQI